jgi:hypothetical protein
LHSDKDGKMVYPPGNLLEQYGSEISIFNLDEATIDYIFQFAQPVDFPFSSGMATVVVLQDDAWRILNQLF